MRLHKHRRLSGPIGQAVRILERLADELPMRSLERDIVVSAALYLEGEIGDGVHSIVAEWYRREESA